MTIDDDLLVPVLEVRHLAYDAAVCEPLGELVIANVRGRELLHVSGYVFSLLDDLFDGVVIGAGEGSIETLRYVSQGRGVPSIVLLVWRHGVVVAEWVMPAAAWNAAIRDLVKRIETACPPPGAPA